MSKSAQNLHDDLRKMVLKSPPRGASLKATENLVESWPLMAPLPDSASLRTPSGSNGQIHSATYKGSTPIIPDRTIVCAQSRNDSAICFSPCGDFDIYNKDELAAALRQGIAYPTFVVDLERTTYIDASILGVLVGLARRRKISDATPIRIIHVRDQIHKLFTICKLEHIFDIGGELAAAPISARSA